MNLFSSLKILDLTQVFSGPFATRHFADFGAEVIKIESPSGDDSRNFPPLVNNWSGYFEILNKNKKSLILDLKNKKFLDIFYDLCKTCDVIVENFSYSVTNKLKIDYSTIKKINPRIIYASITGVSSRIDKKYYDVIAQADSGLISLNGDKEDMKISTSIIDAFSGMKLAYAISSALYAREKNNFGCQISVSMKGVAFDLLEQNLITTSLTNKNPKKVGNMDSAIAPFGVFKTKDAYITITIGNNKQWIVFQNFLFEKNKDFPVNLFMSNSKRLKNIKRLQKEIENILSNYSVIYIEKELTKIKIPCTRVKKMSDVLLDQENFSEKLLKKVKHPIVGNIVLSTGGIFFSKYKMKKYTIAPLYDKGLEKN